MHFKQLSAFNAEAIYFYGCLLAVTGILLFGGSFPTLDGPSHTYNAQLTNYIIHGNSFIGKYFGISPKPSPNYTDHYLLVLLLNIVSFQWAGKILQVVYVLSFAILFRMIVRRFNPSGMGMSILAIPYAFHFLYYLGFYNFCLSLPLLFVIILYYNKHISNTLVHVSFFKYVILSGLLLVLYFTNGLSFLYAGLILSVFETRTIYFLWRDGGENKVHGQLFQRILLFTSVWIPGLLLFIVFMVTTPQDSTGETHSFLQNLADLIQSRVLMIYDGGEYPCVHLFSYVVAIGVAGAVIHFFVKRKTADSKSTIVFLLVAIVSALLYFLVPDSFSVGMMSIRLAIFFFVFFLFWFAMQENYKVITWLISISVMCVFFVLLFGYRMPVENDMQKKSEVIGSVGDYIHPNSAVLDINVTNNWLYGHFGDYLAINKALVIIPNYEADYGWFGVLWNSNMPRFIFNNKDHIDSLYNLPGPTNYKTTKEIDYVFIHGAMSQIYKDSKWADVKKGLLNRYVLAYASADSSIHLYQLKELSTELLPK